MGAMIFFPVDIKRKLSEYVWEMLSERIEKKKKKKKNENERGKKKQLPAKKETMERKKKV